MVTSLAAATSVQGAPCLITVFFFPSRRRHTRLQGDWSSDVCSSDLPRAADPQHADTADLGDVGNVRAAARLQVDSRNPRSEERRVGKECRSRWSPYH